MSIPQNVRRELDTPTLRSTAPHVVRYFYRSSTNPNNLLIGYAFFSTELEAREFFYKYGDQETRPTLLTRLEFLRERTQRG